MYLQHCLFSNQQLKRLAYRVETAGPVVATATVATTRCVKAPYYRKDTLVRAKLQFEGFDNATQPQKPHWESVRPVFALCPAVIFSSRIPILKFLPSHIPPPFLLSSCIPPNLFWTLLSGCPYGREQVI